MTIQIGYIQWLRDNGYGQPSEPILKQVKNILHMDAILGQTSEVFKTSEAYEPTWPPADVIVGNPPFLGVRKMREQLGHEYVEELRRLYLDRLPPSIDLVCYWFEKARAMIEDGKAKRAGLLATNSIRGGANRATLDRIEKTGSIFWALSDHEWILDGAAVNVSMIGFDNGDEKHRSLDSIAVTKIDPDLTSAVDLTSAKILSENDGLAFQDTAQVGPFEIEEGLAIQMLSAHGNPNNRPNSDVIKRSLNGLDIVRNPRNMWTIDFGTEMSVEEASKYEVPFEYVKKHVKPMRDNVRRKNHREY